jgi:oxygen-independent coproporphyrinogen-3 oxidase
LIEKGKTMLDLTNTILNFMTKRKLKGAKFSNIVPPLPESKELGLYIHIPFCRIPCPFCPYNRYPWQSQKEKPYLQAVKKEIETYKEMLQGVTIDTLYIGGGTPTVMVDGLVEILAHAQNCFTIQGDICIEANPDDLNPSSLDKLRDIGVKKISIGVQSFDDNILKAIGRRSHDGKTAQSALKLALASGFECVNADLMFSLPYQNVSQVMADLQIATELGVHQITTYPLLLFPYTKMSKDVKDGKVILSNGKVERAIYHEIVRFLTSNGYEMCTVWGFARKGGEKYGSVEREEYIGIGAGAITVTNQFTYQNTFPVDEYIQAVEKGLPVAVGRYAEKDEVMAKWFMMRLYELGFEKKEFVRNFAVQPEQAIKGLMRIFRLLGIIEVNEESIKVTRQGLYPVHIMTKTFLNTYISRLCEEGMKSPWPTEFQI